MPSETDRSHFTVTDSKAEAAHMPNTHALFDPLLADIAPVIQG